MILVYHNISTHSKNDNTVCILYFFIHLLIIKFLNKSVVWLSDYDSNDKNQIVLRFDDGYKNIKKYVIPMLKLFNFKCELFIVPTFLNNKGYLTTADLDKLPKNICRLQYHTLSHKDLTSIEDNDILEKEIIPAKQLINYDGNNFKYIAYPFWKYNNNVINIVKKYYNGGLSGNGFSDNTKWAMDGVKIPNKIIPTKI